MAIDAGGTRQRLKPGGAMIDSFSRNLGIAMVGFGKRGSVTVQGKNATLGSIV
jgi:hypothetical protein